MDEVISRGKVSQSIAFSSSGTANKGGKVIQRIERRKADAKWVLGSDLQVYLLINALVCNLVRYVIFQQ